MSYFRSSENVFCDSVKAEVAADGGKAEGLKPSRHLSSAMMPYRLSCLCVRFDGEASGSLSVSVVKKGTEFLVRSQELEGAESVVVSGIGIWLEPGDSVTVANDTGAAATAVLDFAY